MRGKVYCGRRKPREAGPAMVWVNGKPLDPARSQRVHNHSPDGFNWGYCGSGPAQLALALLLDATTQPRAARYWHQEFKRRVIAALPDEWVMTQEEIMTWYQTAKLDSQPTKEEIANAETQAALEAPSGSDAAGNGASSR